MALIQYLLPQFNYTVKGYSSRPFLRISRERLPDHPKIFPINFGFSVQKFAKSTFFFLVHPRPQFFVIIFPIRTKTNESDVR